MLELVQKLKAPMAAQGVALKQYLADTVLPAYSHVKDVHGVLEDKGAHGLHKCRHVRALISS